MVTYEPQTFYGYQVPDTWTIDNWLFATDFDTLITWVCQMNSKKFTGLEPTWLVELWRIGIIV